MPEPLTIVAATVMYASACLTHRGRGSFLHGDPAASIQQSLSVFMPTGVTMMIGSTDDPAFQRDALESTGWMELSNTVFGGSRGMSAEERATLDDFTWAELRS